MSDTHVTITGFVATDVKFIRSERGTSLASFRLGSTPRRYDRNQGAWVDGRTTFVTVLCWRALAENVVSSVNKGEPVVVTGRLRVEEWERDGRSGTSAEIEAQTVGHDQARGTSMFRKTRRETSPSTSDTDGADAHPAPNPVQKPAMNAVAGPAAGPAAGPGAATGDAPEAASGAGSRRTDRRAA